ncbi:MAG: hypothetical protein ACE1ZW_05780, partial [Nitrospirales bacterium]
LARREDCAYSSYGKDEQRRQTGWIDAQTGEVILARALIAFSIEFGLYESPVQGRKEGVGRRKA